MTQKSMTSRAWLELSLLAAIWGASFLAIRFALDWMGPITAVLHRTFWAMLVLWVVIAMRRMDLPRDPKIWAAFLVMGLLNNVIPFGLMAWGQLYIPSGLTAVLNASTALFGVVLAALVFADERLTGRKATGVLLGFVGVLVAIGPGVVADFNITSLAQLAVLGGAASYACASVWARTMLGGIPPVLAAAGMLTGSTLIMIPLTLMTEGVPRLDLPLIAWSAIAYYAIGATALAYLLYYRVLGMAGSGNLMLVTLMIPPLAIALGAWIRGEALSTNAFAGFALLAIGLIVLDGRLLAPARGLTKQRR